jgi:hypothetical protein
VPPLRAAKTVAVTFSLFFAFASMAAPPALAQTPRDADRATARALMVKGYDALDRGDAPQAREGFLAANALVHLPTTAFALARADLALHRLIEAHEALVELAHMPERAGESPDFATARTEGQRLRLDLEARIPSIRIVVTGVEAEAPLTVVLDDEALPAATLGTARLVDPGPHTVRAEVGSRSKVTTFDVAEREQQVVTLAFDANSKGGVPLHSERPKDARAAPAAPPRGLGTATWISLGVTAAAVAVGGAAGGVALVSKNAAVGGGCQNDACPSPAQPDAHRAEAFATVSTISFAVAGVAALVSLTSYFLLRPSSPAAAQAQSGRTVLLIGGSGLGIAF